MNATNKKKGNSIIENLFGFLFFVNITDGNGTIITHSHGETGNKFELVKIDSEFVKFGAVGVLVGNGDSNLCSDISIIDSYINIVVIDEEF